MSEKSGLFTKVCKVMAEIETLPKNGFNAFHKYAYASDEDVLNLMRGKLAAVGIAIKTKMIDVEFMSNSVVMLSLEITLIDAETKEEEVYPWFATAQDKQDKGIYKAVTTGLKYFLLKQFLVSTGDGESDADHGTQPQRSPANRPVQRRPQVVPASTKQKADIQALMKTLGYENVDAALVERRYPALEKLSGVQATEVVEKLKTKVQEKGTE